jgi:hypothetical protein
MLYGLFLTTSNPLSPPVRNADKRMGKWATETQQISNIGLPAAHSYTEYSYVKFSPIWHIDITDRQWVARRSWAFVEKLTVTQPPRKFSVFHESRISLSFSWEPASKYIFNRWSQATPWHHSSLLCISILFSCLRLQSDFFPLGFPVEMLVNFSVSLQWKWSNGYSGQCIRGGPHPPLHRDRH